MTLEEKLGQLQQLGLGTESAGVLAIRFCAYRSSRLFSWMFPRLTTSPILIQSLLFLVTTVSNIGGRGNHMKAKSHKLLSQLLNSVCP